jgi:glucose-6-phosphate-specific signal transduction histidine kinase
LRNARAFPLLPAALASVPFGFVLVRVRVHHGCHVSQNGKVEVPQGLALAIILRLNATKWDVLLKKIALVWYKKEKEGENTLSKSERRTVLLLASFIPG